MSAPQPASVRYHFLDALRAILMMYGLFVHTSTLGPSPLFRALAVVSGVVRMEAFFMISGFLSLMLVHKYGPSTTVIKRVASIGIPFAATLLLLNPATNYLVYTYHNGIIPFSEYLRGDILPEPAGPMVWHLHLWFLVTLLVYGIATPWAAAAIEDLQQRDLFRRFEQLDVFWQFSLVCAVVPATCLGLRIVFEVLLEVPLTGSPLFFITKSTLVYFPFFFVGMLMYASKGVFAAFIARMHWGHLGISLGLTVASRYAFDALPKLIAEGFKLTAEAYLATCLSAALFVLFRRMVPEAHPVARYLSDAAYSVYLFHYASIYVLAWTLRPALGDNHALYLSVCVATLLLTLLVHHFLILRSHALRVVFNGKLQIRRPGVA